MFRRILPCLPLCFAPILGCSYYDASLLEPRGSSTDAATDAGMDAADATSEPSVEASSDAPVDSSEDVESGGDAVVDVQSCGHTRPPDPPSVTGAGGDIEFVVAVSAINFGDTAGNPKQIGYDLDFRCTCQGESNGCLRQSWATADACDGPEGRDNSTGAFISQVSSLFGGFGSVAWSEAAIAGEWSLLLRISGYNGLPDDDQVRLDWYVPDQYWEDKPDKTFVPAWDGTDAWPIRASCLIDQGEGTYDLSALKYFDENAYVTGGVLVGSLTESAFQVSADYAIQFNGAFITAKVVDGTLGWALQEGLLAARWKLDNILAQVSRINVMNMPVCTDHIAYGSLKSQVCAYADMYSGVGSPTTPCDSISTGMTFETFPAKLGNVFVDALTGNACDPSVDPANDSCDNL